MRGIILAGGAGSRLYPISRAYSKQLMYVYDKPMIYYPLSSLMLGGIREILVITTPADQPAFRNLLGDGSHLGLRLEYATQASPAGIAQAFTIGESFIGDGPVCLILGDNLFYGHFNFFREAVSGFDGGALIFGYRVKDPERYGVVEYDAADRVVSIEEKPARPRSSYAVPGLYLYDNSVVERTRALKPSARGELEITDLNRAYLAEGALRVHRLGRGIAWLDTGTVESLLDANNFIGSIENRQGLKIGCIEEVARRMGFLDGRAFGALVGSLPASPYRQYLEAVAAELAD